MLTLSLVAFPGLSAQAVLPSPAPNEAAQQITEVDFSNDVPAHVAVVDGPAFLERDGLRDRATENVPLLTGDRLRTDIGRVEVMFEDGSVLDLDERTDLEFLSDSLVRLHRGRIRLLLARTSKTPAYRVDAAGTSTEIRTAGEYRITLADPDRDPAVVSVTVIRGLAELSTVSGHTLIHPGTEAAADAQLAPSLPYAVTTAAWDAFSRWTDDQSRRRNGAESAQYLPEEVQPYSGDFDTYGSWGYYQPYGYVWYPTVAVGWRPYSAGRWSFAAHFGWFWVGTGRWTWPTHHYGRWGVAGSRWFWIPGQQWGPAWVSWASAPGYVGWCPLGYNNHPVYPFSLTSYQTWNGWTVLPTRTFRPNVVVTQHAVRDHAALTAPNVRFETRRGAPARPTGVSVDGRPVRAPSTDARTAVPRTGMGTGGAASVQSAQSTANASATRGVTQGSATTARTRSVAGSNTASAATQRVGSQLVANTQQSPARDASRAVPRAASRPSLPATAAADAPEPRRTNLPAAESPVTRPTVDTRTAAPQTVPWWTGIVRTVPDSAAQVADRRASEPAAPRAGEPGGLSPGQLGVPHAVERRAGVSTSTAAPGTEPSPTWRLRTSAPEAPSTNAPDRAVPRGEPADSGWSRPNPSRTRESAPPAPASSTPGASAPATSSPAPSNPAPSRSGSSSSSQPAQPAPASGGWGVRQAVPRSGR